MMLSRDSSGQICGYLELDKSEDGEGKHYTRHYFVLNAAEKKLLYYPCPPTANDIPPQDTFDLQLLSMVEDAANFKSKHPLCLVLTVCGKQVYLKARDNEEKQEWIEHLQNVARIKVTKRISTGSQSGDVGYRTAIYGGVVVKTPFTVPENAYDSGSEDDSYSDSRSNYANFSLSQKPLKEGYCIKQGAFMKTWKRRWFVLADGGLAYYKSYEQKTPIRVIPRQEIIDARRSVGIHLTREHLFEVVTPSRVYYIQAENDYHCEDWIAVIKDLLSPNRNKSSSIVQTDHTGTLSRSSSTTPTTPVTENLSQDFACLHARNSDSS